jgi:hypothetical protein
MAAIQLVRFASMLNESCWLLRNRCGLQSPSAWHGCALPPVARILLSYRMRGNADLAIRYSAERVIDVNEYC